MNSTRKAFQVLGSRFEYSLEEQVSAPITIVLLHEGLGCVELWRDFPARLAEQTGCTVLSYSRLGHGRSDSAIDARGVDYLHKEAYEILPAVLDNFKLSSAVLWGHSDGASIALLAASKFPERTKGVIAAAPHLFVEDVTVAGIREADTRAAQLVKRLERYHNDAGSLFAAWRDIWLSTPFRSWNIEQSIAEIQCPILAIQGRDDQYGTLAQVQRIQELAPQTRLLVLDECAHAPHQEQPEQVLKGTVAFLETIVSSSGENLSN